MSRILRVAILIDIKKNKVPLASYVIEVGFKVTSAMLHHPIILNVE